MLKNKLYRIDAQHYAPERLDVDLHLCLSHEIFDGHFPDQPILPGVCTLQICKELLADFIKKPISITAFQSIKYTKLIDPRATPTLHISMTVSEWINNQQRIQAVVMTKAGEVASKLLFQVTKPYATD